MKKLALSLLILLAAFPAFAQHWQDSPGPRCENPAHWEGSRGHMERGMRGEHRDGPPQKMVEAFRLYKLTEYLELSEDQTEKIYPRLAELNRLHDEHREQMREKMKELRSLLEDEKTKQAAKLAEEIHDLRGELRATLHEKQGEIMSLLDEEQRAKYVLFEARFEKHLKQVARRLHGRHSEQKGEKMHPGPGPRDW